MPNIIALSMPGPTEWIIIAILGLLIFGKRLPEVGRSLGKGIVEFKKGLKGVEEEIEGAVNMDEEAETTVSRPETAQRRELPPQSTPAPQPKFDPYTGERLQPKFDPYTGKPLESQPSAPASTEPAGSHQA